MFTLCSAARGPVLKQDILDAVLIVAAAKHARLELKMSHHEPSVWWQGHSYEIDGKLIERKV